MPNTLDLRIGDNTTEDGFVMFASRCAMYIRKGNPWEAARNWTLASRFAGELHIHGVAKGGPKFDRAWILLKALEGAAAEKGML